jgi:signal transduction histidine kinase/phage shock protein PspC (stress-responsive transcriptional regulator)
MNGMSQTAYPQQPPAPSQAGSPAWVPRKAHRSRRDSYLGGVAGGLAEHLGVDPVLVRGFFVLSTLAAFGLVLYLALWVMLPMDNRPEASSPGLESATRRGLRPGRPDTRRRDTGILLALGVLVVGLAGLTDVFTGSIHLLWPGAFAVLGVAVLWLQADEAQRERWRHAGDRVGIGRILLGSGGAAAWARLVAGAGLLVTALVIFAAQSGQVTVARDMVVAGILGMGGLAIVLGPWLFSLASELTDERAERIRTQERADVAAHLHDSVLQTLAMIQRSSGDPPTVARLARAQERDLRQWLYGDQAAPEGTLAASLSAVAAEAEDLHGVPVEVVTVGDRPTTAALVPLVGATREAVLNAVRHSGAPRVDVYAEMAGDHVEVFVRDRGRGFDLAAVPQDRQGVRGSVIGRMERHGGSAEVRSTPGGGTEVRLGMPAVRATEEDA